VVHVSSIGAGMGGGDLVRPSPEGLGMSRPGPLVVGQTVIDVGFHHDIILRAAAASKLPVGVLSRG